MKISIDAIAWYGLKQSLADTIRPALLPYLEQVLDWTRTNQPEIKKAIDDTVSALVTGTPNPTPMRTAIILVSGTQSRTRT